MSGSIIGAPLTGAPLTGAPLPAIVLAGERPGGNALARAHRLTSALAIVAAGRPIIDWTMTALSQSGCAPLHLVGPEAAVVAANPALAAWCEQPQVNWHPPAAGPAASAATTATAVGQFPVLLTAADHALLRAPWIDDFCARAAAQATRSGADLIVGLVPYALVRERFPGNRRTVLRFADQALCGSNLFYLASPLATAALQYWQRLESYRKTPWKMAASLGWSVCLRYWLRQLTLAAALGELSERAGCEIQAVLLDEPRLAVDVDSEADLQLADRLLAQ